MQPQQWRDSGSRFFHNGHNIFYREEGEGEHAIVFLHGFPTASWDWHRVWPVFRKRYRLIAPDFIGFGYSDKPREYEYSIVDQANLVETLFKALKIERLNLFAHDYGDSVAQELLARFEKRRRRGEQGVELLSVCYLNGGLFPEVHRARPIQRLLLTPLGPLIARGMNEKRFHRQFRAIFGPDTKPHESELRDYWSLVNTESGARIAHKLIRYIPERVLNRERWLDAMQSTPVPQRFINGALDPVSGAHMAARYRELIPSPDVVDLHKIGHYPQMEAPMMVAEEYIRLLKRAGAA